MELKEYLEHKREMEKTTGKFMVNFILGIIGLVVVIVLLLYFTGQMEPRICIPVDMIKELI